MANLMKAFGLQNDKDIKMHNLVHFEQSQIYSLENKAL